MADNGDHLAPPTAATDRWWANLNRGQWLAMVAAVMGWMFDGFEMGLHSLVVHPALHDLLSRQAAQAGTALSEAEMQAEIGRWNSYLTAIFLFGAAAGGLVFGWLGDRIGRTRALTLSVLFYALFTGAGGLAEAPWHLAVVRLLAALGMGGEWSLGVALVMEVWPAGARPMLAGVIGAAANIGFLLIAVVSLFLNEILAGFGVDRASSWPYLMFIGVTPAVMTFGIRLLVPESEKWKHAVAESDAKPNPTELLSPALWSRTVLAVCLTGVALLGTWGAVQWIPAWTADMTRDSGPTAAKEYAQMASAGGAIFGSGFAALLAWNIGRRVSYAILCVASLAATGWLFRTPQSFGPEFLILVFLVGLTSASFYGWAPLYLPELFPTRIRATGQGVAFNFGRIIAGVGTLVLTGSLMAEFKANFQEALAWTSLIYGAGLVLIWFAPETHNKPLPE